jgi:hypothetical protein
MLQTSSFTARAPAPRAGASLLDVLARRRGEASLRLVRLALP